MVGIVFGARKIMREAVEYIYPKLSCPICNSDMEFERYDILNVVMDAIFRCHNCEATWTYKGRFTLKMEDDK